MISIFSTKVTASLGFCFYAILAWLFFFSSGFIIDFCAETPILDALLMLGDLDYGIDGLFFIDSLLDSLISEGDCYYYTGSL